MSTEDPHPNTAESPMAGMTNEQLRMAARRRSIAARFGSLVTMTGAPLTGEHLPYLERLRADVSEWLEEINAAIYSADIPAQDDEDPAQ